MERHDIIIAAIMLSLLLIVGFFSGFFNTVDEEKKHDFNPPSLSSTYFSLPNDNLEINTSSFAENLAFVNGFSGWEQCLLMLNSELRNKGFDRKRPSNYYNVFSVRVVSEWPNLSTIQSLFDAYEILPYHLKSLLMEEGGKYSWPKLTLGYIENKGSESSLKEDLKNQIVPDGVSILGINSTSKITIGSYCYYMSPGQSLSFSGVSKVRIHKSEIGSRFLVLESYSVWEGLLNILRKSSFYNPSVP